jgi:hypothetical protein
MGGGLCRGAAGAVGRPLGTRAGVVRQAQEVAARAGHASASFTLDRYGHLYPEADLSLRERLDAIWSASGGGS